MNSAIQLHTQFETLPIMTLVPYARNSRTHYTKFKQWKTNHAHHATNTGTTPFAARTACNALRAAVASFCRRIHSNTWQLVIWRPSAGFRQRPSARKY